MTLYAAIDEKELLLWMQAGDEAAFTELYNRFWEPLYKLAFLKLKDFGEAEEIVQDVFCDFWRRKAEHKIEGPLSAYFSSAIKYQVLNILAKKNRHQRYLKATEISSILDRSTEQWLTFEELREQLELQITKLPERCRLVFQLSREKGFSQKQISSVLGISENTVESHIAKALRILRTSLHQFFTLILF